MLQYNERKGGGHAIPSLRSAVGTGHPNVRMGFPPPLRPEPPESPERSDGMGLSDRIFWGVLFFLKNKNNVQYHARGAQQKKKHDPTTPFRGSEF